MKRYQRKGFTLLELIIVIALFAIIMVSVVKLLDPVSKFFVRSSNFEMTNACIDNMRRSIEGNLQYADRAWLYEKQTPYVYTETGGVQKNTDDYKPTADLKAKVQDFYNYYFLNRKFLDCIGTIYVLVFDNTQIASDTGLKNYQILSDISDNELNRGKMVRYEFEFDNYITEPGKRLKLDSYKVTPWYVNQSLYGNFEYTFTLGEASTEVDAEGNPAFNPKDCTIGITMNEIKKSPEGLVREPLSKANNSTFSMKNVLDAAKKYEEPLKDYIMLESDDYGDPANILDWFKRDTTELPRWRRHPVPAGAAAASSFDGFYFIYTLPETTLDLTDKDLGGSTDPLYNDDVNKANDYLEAVKNKYNP